MRAKSSTQRCPALCLFENTLAPLVLKILDVHFALAASKKKMARKRNKGAHQLKVMVVGSLI